MDKLVKLTNSFSQTKLKNVEDFADRLNHRYTVGVLVVFAVLVSARQYVGTPITCWAPVHFTGSHKKYANSYCWVKNTYFTPFNEHIPKEHEDDKRDEVMYYQWVPFILLVQAVFFYLPNFVWRALNEKSGVDMDNILVSADTFQRIDKSDNKERTLKFITKQMDRFLASRIDLDSGIVGKLKLCLNRTLCVLCGRRFGTYLTFLFILTKVLYLFNVVTQLFLLNKILGGTFNVFGLDMVYALVTDHDWENKPLYFPRVTMCDFKVRRLGNVHRYTLQCVLPINLYTEKIYFFLWFWMVLVAGVTCCSLLTWVLRAVCRTDSHSYVQNHLRTMDRIQTTLDESRAREFVNNYLKPDGVLVLRLIGHNTNSIVTSEIMCSVYDYWKNKVRKPNSGLPNNHEEKPLPVD